MLQLICLEVITALPKARRELAFFEESPVGIRPTCIVLSGLFRCVTDVVKKKEKETKQMRTLWPLAEYRSQMATKEHFAWFFLFFFEIW